MSMICQLIGASTEELNAIVGDSSDVMAFLQHRIQHADNQCDLYKAWHGLHFLLTGDPWEGEPPLSYAVFGDQPLCEEDFGYGPPRYLTPDQVKEVSQALQQLQPDEMRLDYDNEEMRVLQIYSISEDEEDEWEWLLGYFQQLVQFYNQAAKEGQAVVAFLS